jgi:hypothetical protein
MDAYFFDVNNRYIGKRALNSGEAMPANATSISVTQVDGQEAHFISGSWIVSDLPEQEPTEPCAPCLESRINGAEDAIMAIVEMMG